MNFLPAAKVRVMAKKPFRTDKISKHTALKTLGKEEVKTSAAEAIEGWRRPVSLVMERS
jgi:hypothetical protein